MAVGTATGRVSYPGNGTADTFAFPFRINAAADIRAIVINDATSVETVLTLTTQYTVTGSGVDAGGSITLVYNAAWPWVDSGADLVTGYTLVILPRPALTQVSSYRNLGRYSGPAAEADLDLAREVDIAQQDQLDAALQLPEGEARTAAKRTLPTLATRTSKFFAWDASGNPIASVSGAAAAAVSAWGATLIDDADATAGRATIGLAPTDTAQWGAAQVIPTAASLARTFSAILDDEINVLSFAGVDSTGVADSTAAIQAAIDRAEGQGGRTVVIPRGTYKITSTLTIESANVVIRGLGGSMNPDSGSVILKWYGAAGGTIMKCAQGSHGFRCESLYFHGNSLAATCLHIEVNTGFATHNPVVSHVFFRKYTGYALVLGSTSTTVIGAGQLASFRGECLRWAGGVNGNGAILINAQNCEYASFHDLHIDGDGYGEGQTHARHIFQFSGGLSISDMTSTRGSTTDYPMMFGDRLRIDSWTSEDSRLFDTRSAGFSYGALLTNVFHRTDGPAVTAAVWNETSGRPLTMISCELEGNLVIGATTARSMTLDNVSFTAGGIVYNGPCATKAVISDPAGARLSLKGNDAKIGFVTTTSQVLDTYFFRLGNGCFDVNLGLAVLNGSNVERARVTPGTSGDRGVLKLWDVGAAAFRYAYLNAGAWVIAAAEPT